jgi:hypothetical protein
MHANRNNIKYCSQERAQEFFMGVGSKIFILFDNGKLKYTIYYYYTIYY